MRSVADRLKQFSPCPEALAWAADYKSPAKAWRECQDGSWMLWLLGKVAGPPEGEGRKKLVLAACECARLALPHTKDPRVLACIETTEQWASGAATIAQLREARRAAYAYAAFAYAAAYADALALVHPAPTKGE